MDFLYSLREKARAWKSDPSEENRGTAIDAILSWLAGLSACPGCGVELDSSPRFIVGRIQYCGKGACKKKIRMSDPQ